MVSPRAWISRAHCCISEGVVTIFMFLLFPGSHAAHANCVEHGDGIAVKRPQTAFDVDFGTGELKPLPPKSNEPADGRGLRKTGLVSKLVTRKAGCACQGKSFEPPANPYRLALSRDGREREAGKGAADSIGGPSGSAGASTAAGAAVGTFDR